MASSFHWARGVDHFQKGISERDPHRVSNQMVTELSEEKELTFSCRWGDLNCWVKFYTGQTVENAGKCLFSLKKTPVPEHCQK